MDISANTAAFIRDAFDAAVVEYGEFDLAPEAFQAAVLERAPHEGTDEAADEGADEAAVRDLRLADLYLALGCAAGHDEAWRVLRKFHKAEMTPAEDSRALLATYPATTPLRDWLVAAGKAAPRRTLPGGHLVWTIVALAAIAAAALLWTDRSGEPGDADLIAAFETLRDDDPELFKGVEPLLAAERAAPRPTAVAAPPVDTALRIRVRRGLKAIDRLADPRVRHVVRAHFLIRLARYDAAAAELTRAPPSDLAEETKTWLLSSRG